MRWHMVNAEALQQDNPLVQYHLYILAFQEAAPLHPFFLPLY